MSDERAKGEAAAKDRTAEPARQRFQAPKGTADMLPDRARVWQFLQGVATELFETYGYAPLVTPTFEATELFARGIGDATDIVKKEMYTFEDKGGRSVTLRPEGTASAVRAAIEHHLIGQGRVAKLYYGGPMFRYERPQSGRMREFYQLGVEALGSEDPALDAEVIALMVRYFEELGLSDLELLVSSMGCPECRADYEAALRGYLAGHREGLCPDCVERAEVNPPRVFDCKVAGCQEAVEAAPKLVDHLGEACGCAADLATVRGYLDDLGIEHDVDPRLVRGLDYYTRTVFEARSPLLGAQNAVGGGGRYDRLVEELGGPAGTPGLGFALGVERTILALEAQAGSLDLMHDRPVLVASVDDSSRPAAVRLVQALRDDFIVADLDYAGRGLKGQMKQAARLQSPFVVILGPDELAVGECVVRDMESGEEWRVALAEVVDFLGDALMPEELRELYEEHYDEDYDDGGHDDGGHDDHGHGDPKAPGARPH